MRIPVIPSSCAPTYDTYPLRFPLTPRSLGGKKIGGLLLQLQVPEFLRPAEVKDITNALMEVRRSCRVGHARKRKHRHLVINSHRNDAAIPANLVLYLPHRSTRYKYTAMLYSKPFFIQNSARQVVNGVTTLLFCRCDVICCFLKCTDGEYNR